MTKHERSENESRIKEERGMDINLRTKDVLSKKLL